jgi:multiple sugar transport system substrate-binding protein
MMIMFIAHASGLADTAGTKIAGKIGYDIIPGGCPLLGGWSIGINSSSSRPKESFSFISWAASKELAIPQTILGGSTASISLYKSSELLTIYPWLPKALESFKTSRKRDISRSTTMGRLSEKDFEQILGNAIHNVIKGETEPEEAADEVFHEILEGLSNTGG